MATDQRRMSLTAGTFLVTVDRPRVSLIGAPLLSMSFLNRRIVERALQGPGAPPPLIRAHSSRIGMTCSCHALALSSAVRRSCAPKSTTSSRRPVVAKLLHGRRASDSGGGQAGLGSGQATRDLRHWSRLFGRHGIKSLENAKTALVRDIRAAAARAGVCRDSLPIGICR